MNLIKIFLRNPYSFMITSQGCKNLCNKSKSLIILLDSSSLCKVYFYQLPWRENAKYVNRKSRCLVSCLYWLEISVLQHIKTYFYCIREAFKKKNRGFSEFGTISLRTPPPYQIVKNIIVKIGPYS